MVRPENIFMAEEAERPDINRLRVHIRNKTYQGDRIRYRFEINGQTLIAEVQNRPDRPVCQQGDEVEIGWLPDSTVVLTG